MVKNRAAKDAARKLKASTGITYPRALDLARLNGKETSVLPPLRIGWAEGKELTWQPGPGSVLEISGVLGSGKTRLLKSLATQSLRHVETYIVDTVRDGAEFTDLPETAVIVDVARLVQLADAFEAAPRFAIVISDESKGLLPGQPELPGYAESLKRLVSSGAAVVTATMLPAGWHDDSSRILLGSSRISSRVTFLGHRGLESAGSLRGHFSAADEVSVQPFCLLPETDRHYQKPPTVEMLGLPEEAMYFADATPGLYLFAGQTGTGKTSSVAALLNQMDKDNPRISLIEVTAELIVPEREGVSRVETGTADMTSSIKQAMRSSPDVIVVGEVREASTLMATLGAASAGHCVYATIHAGAAEGVIERALDMIPEASLAEAKAMMADSLRGILFHGRMPGVDGARSFRVVRFTGNPEAAA